MNPLIKYISRILLNILSIISVIKVFIYVHIFQVYFLICKASVRVQALIFPLTLTRLLVYHVIHSLGEIGAAKWFCTLRQEFCRCALEKGFVSSVWNRLDYDDYFGTL